MICKTINKIAKKKKHTSHTHYQLRRYLCKTNGNRSVSAVVHYKKSSILVNKTSMKSYTTRASAAHCIVVGFLDFRDVPSCRVIVLLRPRKIYIYIVFLLVLFPPLVLYNLSFPILPSRMDKHQLICIYSTVPLNFYALKHQIGLF